MNLLDIALIIIVGLSVLGGFREGFARSGIGFVASLVGIFAGIWYAREVGAHLSRFTTSVMLQNLFGFFIVLGACVLCGALMGAILANVFKWVGVSWLDRLAGGLFGFARGALVAVAMLTLYLACAPGALPRAVTHSRFAPYLIDASSVIATMIPSDMRDKFHSATGRIRRAWSEHMNEEAAHI